MNLGEALPVPFATPRPPLETTVTRPPMYCCEVRPLAGGDGRERSMSQAIARSKSYALAARASSSSDGASVVPKTELSTSNGVIPSVSMTASSASFACAGCSVGESCKSVDRNLSSSADKEEFELDSLDHCTESKSSESSVGNDSGGGGAFVLNGSNGSWSSSSSLGPTDARRLELGVGTRDMLALSGSSGAAIARFDDALCAHRSGDGVCARSADSELVNDAARASGRGIGLNSCAFAFSNRGDESGDGGRLAANCACACVACACASVGEDDGESDTAFMYDVDCDSPSGDTTGVCGRRKAIPSGELGAELDTGVSGRPVKRTECEEAREDGREIGRRGLLTKRKGTPDTSFR